MEIGAPFKVACDGVREGNTLTLAGDTLRVEGRGGERYVRLIGEPLTSRLEIEGKGFRGADCPEPTGEEVEEEVSESESTETSDNKDVAEEETAESENVDRDASEPVDEPKDEEPVEESDQDDVPSEETADAEDADPEEEVSEESSEEKSD